MHVDPIALLVVLSSAKGLQDVQWLFFTAGIQRVPAVVDRQYGHLWTRLPAAPTPKTWVPSVVALVRLETRLRSVERPAAAST
jgi:hypothetical protein